MKSFTDIKQVISYLAEHHFISSAVKTCQLNSLQMGGPILWEVRRCYTIDHKNKVYVIRPEFTVTIEPNPTATEQEKRQIYVSAFGKEYDSPDRKQLPLSLDLAYIVAIHKLNNI